MLEFVRIFMHFSPEYIYLKNTVQLLKQVFLMKCKKKVPGLQMVIFDSVNPLHV